VSSFSEFLASEADKLRAEQAEAMGKREEFVKSVQRLLGQIKEWLEQADVKRILMIDESPIRLSERGLGTYEVPALTIGLGTREVRVKPIARYVGAPLRATAMLQVPRAYGRVDLTNGLDRYLTFRVEKEVGDRWMIVEQDGPLVEPFDRTSFETALQRLLE
jgi:hypothetical protein